MAEGLGHVCHGGRLPGGLPLPALLHPCASKACERQPDRWLRAFRGPDNVPFSFCIAAMQKLLLLVLLRHPHILCNREFARHFEEKRNEPGPLLQQLAPLS